MGWTVLAQVSIELPKATKDWQTKSISKYIVGYGGYDKPYNFSQGIRWIGFELAGNKGVDYAILDGVKEYILDMLSKPDRNGKMKDLKGLTIIANEFAETGSDGYCYDGDDPQ